MESQLNRAVKSRARCRSGRGFHARREVVALTDEWLETFTTWPL